MRDRYLATAAFCYDMSRQWGLSEHPTDSAMADKLSSVMLGTDQFSWFFAPNATMAMLPIIEYHVARRGLALDFKNGCHELHPVIANAIQFLSSPFSRVPGTVRISTLLHWLTGKFSSSLISEHIASQPNDVEIIDAAQAFGLLTRDELGQLFARVRGGAVAVGCAQKWLGCPLPLGFAIMPVELLERDSDLRDYLSARDYLGNSVQPRHGFISFEDTFSSALAPVFEHFLRAASGLVDDNAEHTRNVVATNRQSIFGWVCGSTRLTVADAGVDSRGIVAAEAPSDVAAAVSQRLLRHAFCHTIFPRLPSEGRTTLRFSAPCIEMSLESKELLEGILKGSDE